MFYLKNYPTILLAIVFILASYKIENVANENILDQCKDILKTVICDPDDIINHKNATALKKSIKSLKCYGDESEENFHMYIIAVRKMNVSADKKKEPNHLLNEAKKQALQLMKHLISTDPHPSGNVLLFISKYDTKFYTVTDNKSTKMLNEDIINEISTETHLTFQGDHYKGLDDTIKQYCEVFKGNYKQRTFLSPQDEPMFLQVVSSKTWNILLNHFLFFVVTSLNVFLFLL